MQFVVIGWDGEDEEAAKRREEARPAHLELVTGMQEKGEAVHGGALLDDDGKMIGSVMIMEFPSRAELQQWLESDPYVTGKVWQKIDIHPFQTAPMFTK